MSEPAAPTWCDGCWRSRLQSVPADRAAAEALLEAAARHLDGVLVVADSDPDGAYTMLYDAARKSLAALV